MRLTLAQLSPRPADVAANAAVVADVAAGRADRDLIVFPELFLCGCLADGYDKLAVPLDGPEVAAIAEAARANRVALVVGAAVRRDGRVENVGMVFAADGAVDLRVKTHLWRAEHTRSTPGSALEPVAVAGVRTGLMVCFDVEFPEVARRLALDGASLLVTIAANMAPFGPDHAAFVRARALENRLPHIYVNRVGRESGQEYVGGSCVVDRGGRTLVEVAGQETVVDVDVELGEPPIDPAVDYLSLRRPDLY